MNANLKSQLMEALGAKNILETETIQSLWSGYGRIFKAKLFGDINQKVIVKHINPPKTSEHPRGWNTNYSHQRKLNSYLVELTWYEQYASLCNDNCRVPRLITKLSDENEHVIVLEDLDDAGFPIRKSGLSLDETKVCLRWLANFHALFMNEKVHGLWDKGSYWHLDTRPDEWNAMPEGELKRAARKIDQILDNCAFKTVIHGDAKVANFCFNGDVSKVSAVDFQYTGLGCGMKDVAYLIGSCMDSETCDRHENELLGAYFNALRSSLEIKGFQGDLAALELEWREMYPFAWTDFTRFLEGWMPNHSKLNDYSEKLKEHVLRSIHNR